MILQKNPLMGLRHLILVVGIALLCLPTLIVSAHAAKHPMMNQGKRPLVMACYYTWYGTPYGAAKTFYQWGSPQATGTFSPQGNNPENVIFVPAIRDISSCAYPLIGPYDSMDPEIVRWHIRLAKAAGIDAFLVDWWGGASWQTPKGWTYDVFVRTVLPIAEQEHFKVALFDETPQFSKDFAGVKKQTAESLKKFKDSPAYLHIDGKPVWVVYQVWQGTLSAAQMRELIAETESAVGPVYWIVDKMRARNEAPKGLELFTPDEWLTIPEIRCFMGYAMFSTLEIRRYDELLPLYTGWCDQVHKAGKLAMVPVHPGMDSRKIQKAEWWIPRENGRTLREFWKAAKDAGTDMICITSFNEWPETSVIEPAMTWPDPYLYLKIVGGLQGRVFKAPPMPSAEHLDPLMAEFMSRNAKTTVSR